MRLPAWLIPEGSRDRLAFLVIVAGAVALRLYGFRGFGAVDDAAYAQIAHHMADGTYRIGSYLGPAVFPLRVGILYPTALAFRWFGVSEWTMVSLPFILSLLSVAMAYVSANYFFGRRAGLFAAGLWALLPIDVFHASVLAPDLPAAFFASLGLMVVIVLARGRGSSGRRLFSGGVGAGLAFGVSWLCKETVAYAVPFCGLLAVLSGRAQWRRQVTLWAGVAAGALAVLLAEMLTYHGATGDWLFRFHETERNYGQYQNAFFVSGSKLAGVAPGGYAKAVLKRLVLGGPLTIFFNPRFLYLPLLAAIISLHALYRRNRSFLLPALWAGTLVLMFNFASSSLASYVPLVLFDRYLYPVFLPAIVLVAGFLAHLGASPPEAREPLPVRREGPFWAATLIGALLLVAADQNYGYRRFGPGWVAEVRHLSGIVKPSDRVYTDILSIHGLEFFWNYPDTMRTVNFEDMNQAAPMRTGDYVLVNGHYLDWLVEKEGWWPTKGAAYATPDFARSPPASWEAIWSNGNATLYRVR